MLIKQFKSYLIFILASLLSLGLSRTLLVIWQMDRLKESQDFLYILIQGARFDIVLMGIVLHLLPSMI